MIVTSHSLLRSSAAVTNLTQPLLLNVVKFSNHIKVKVGEVDPGYAVLYLDAEEIHFNGNGTLHGGVYTSLIDNAIGLSVASLVASVPRRHRWTYISWKPSGRGASRAGARLFTDVADGDCGGGGSTTLRGT